MRRYAERLVLFMYDIGLIGLAVMGENLAINIESKGFSVCVYNRSHDKTNAFVTGRAKGKNISGAQTLEELVFSLKSPRKILLMVKAGSPVDDYIEQLIPLLAHGDIIIDGGNSNFHDTSKRAKLTASSGLLFVGAGISGGEEGALRGPSIMPGGSIDAWEHIAPIFLAIAAKAEDGTSCCSWIGSDGAGHFVKMVHNGIEYGDMQIICEAYYLMREYLGMSAGEMHEVFKSWNAGLLKSYLIEITSDILAYNDEDGSPLVDKILDIAGQKGTGQWAVQTSLEEGVPITLISEAVYARWLSAAKDERVRASKVLGRKNEKSIFNGDRTAFIEDIQSALLASKIVSYAQGFALMRACSLSHDWDLNLGKIAMLWREGCIIRSAFLLAINDAARREPNLENLILNSFFSEAIAKSLCGWRRVCAAAITNGIAIPAMVSALSYYDSYRSEKLPANLLAAQRDYFGAHTYERTDSPRGEFHHTDWTGKGGTTTASMP